MIRLLDLIPLAAGTLLLVNPAQSFTDPPLWTAAVSGGRSLAFALVFLYLGRLFAAQKEQDAGKNGFRSLKRLSFVCLGAGFLYLLYLAAAEISVRGADLSAVLRALAGFLTAGTPQTLWFLPAAILSAGLLFLLPKKNPRVLLPAAAAVYCLTVIVCSYRMLSFPALNAVREVAARIFSSYHNGFLTAFFFVAAGAYCQSSRLKRSAFAYFCGFTISVALLGLETALLSRYFQNAGAYFFLSTGPAAVFLFLFLLKRQGETAPQSSPGGVFGLSLLVGGQFCLAVARQAVQYSGALLSRLFAANNSVWEMGLIVAFLAAVVWLSAFDDKRNWREGFSYYSQALLFAVFSPLARTPSLIGKKIRNGLTVLAFFVMTTLLWFYERGIEYEVCRKTYIVCCVVVLLCAVRGRFRPGGVSAPAFGALFLTGLTLLVSARLFGPESFAQFGLLLLFFFVPLTVFTASAENGARELFSCYTAGSYLSFIIFFEYCVLFRPYDITRYKGPFCNSNMCGLYLVTIFAVALCNLPAAATGRELKKRWAHCLAAGASFGFILLTISRTALAAALALLCVRLLLSFAAVRNERGFRGAVKNTFPLVGASAAGLALCFLATYLCVRWIPALLDRQFYLYVELTDSMLTPYKVLPGAPLNDPNYISLPRFFEAWFSRTVSNYESLNEMSTGRLDIYLTYLKQLTLTGHQATRIPVEGNFSAMFAHNAFLQIAYNCGLPVGLLYLGNLAGRMLRGLFRRERCAAAQAGVILLAAYAVCGMFESIELYYYPILFAAMMGMSFSTLSDGAFAAGPLADGSAGPAADEAAAEESSQKEGPSLPADAAEEAAPEDEAARSTEEGAEKRARIALTLVKAVVAALLLAALLWYLSAVLSVFSEQTRTITQQLLQP